MQRDIVIRRVMTKFTQIPQCSEELRMCFNKDTRRNGIMTPLTITCYFFTARKMPLGDSFSEKKEKVVIPSNECKSRSSLS
jgi:hypothetical protein